MFRPNTHGFHYGKGTQRNKYGKETYGTAVRIPLAVVRADRIVGNTSVRADSSSSRGAAEQTESIIMLLVPKHITVKEGDVIKFLSQYMEVTGTHPRIDVCGNLDHYEVMGDIRSELNVDG